MTDSEMAILKMYGKDTYAINIARAAAQPMVDAGLLEWLPPVWGNSSNYGITEAGKTVALQI